MNVYRRPDHSRLRFLRRTLAAQIHALGLSLALLGALALLPKAYSAGPDHFAACLVFLVTGALVFATSAGYHFLHDGYAISPQLELRLEDFDHYCIYLFIAGTYTPFLINAVAPPWKEVLLVTVWGIAFSGIVYTRLRPHLFKALQTRAVYTSLFVLMGWVFLVRVGEIHARITTVQLSLLLAGVAAYLLGAVGYATRRPVLLVGLFGYHELWHVMVLVGAVFHYFCIYSFYGVGL